VFVLPVLNWLATSIGYDADGSIAVPSAIPTNVWLVRIDSNSALTSKDSREKD
jgi:hypothetical protein